MTNEVFSCSYEFFQVVGRGTSAEIAHRLRVYTQSGCVPQPKRDSPTARSCPNARTRRTAKQIATPAGPPDYLAGFHLVSLDERNRAILRQSSWASAECWSSDPYPL